MEPPPLLKLSFISFCIFLIATYSRFFDWQLSFLHVALVTAIFALIGAALEGRLAGVFSHKVGLCLAILTALYTINIPFSTWRGGSFTLYSGDWLKSIMTFVITAAIIFNIRQCRTALYALGWGTGIGGLLVNWKGEVGAEGRLNFGKGSFHNSNELAFDLLIGLPFLWLILRDPQANKVKKLFALGMMAINFIGIVRSGSRGGLIGVGVFCLLLFLRASMGAKVAMAGIGIVALAGALTVLPNSLKVRYLTLFSGREAARSVESLSEAEAVGSAEASSQERRRLLMASIAATLSHPLLGVGLNTFRVYEAKLDADAGRHTGWQGTHNTYTQVSSEAGIPALIVFVCVIIFSIQECRALSRRASKFPRSRETKEIIDMTFALMATLIIYAVCICFDYIAYSATLPTLAGFTIALMRVGTAELDRLERPLVSERPDAILNLQPVRGGRAARPAVLQPASSAGRF